MVERLLAFARDRRARSLSTAVEREVMAAASRSLETAKGAVAAAGILASSEDTQAKAQRWLESQISLRDEDAEGAEQLSAEQLSHARQQLNGERARRGEASAAARVQVEASVAQLAETEAEASAAAQAKDT